MFDTDSLLNEVDYHYALSGGPGGQHVNKTETKVILIWNVENSTIFSDSQKQLIQKKLASRINNDGLLKLNVAKTRSQLQNKKLANTMLVDLVKKSLEKPKKRIKTKPSRASKLKRLQSKKLHADKKQLRKKPKL